MKYGKLVNGILYAAPRQVIVGNRKMLNPDEETLKNLGFLPITLTEKPTTEDGFHAVCTFEKQAETIVSVWQIEKSIPAEPTTEERIAALETALRNLLPGGEHKDV